MRFGERLAKELRNGGWEVHYIDYAVLKELIKKTVSLESAGKMVEAFHAQEQFAAMLRLEIERVGTFLVTRLETLVESCKMEAFEIEQGAPAGAPEPADASDKATALPEGKALPMAPVKGVDVDVADKLAHLVQSLIDIHDLQQYAIVNREAVRKILKKQQKQTHFGHDVAPDIPTLKLLLEGTTLDASHACYQQLATLFGTLSERRLELCARSSTFAEYMDTLESRIKRTRSMSGDLTLGQEGDSLELNQVILDDQRDSSPLSLACGCPCGVVCRVELGAAKWWGDRKERLTHLALWALGIAVLTCCIIVAVKQPDRLKLLSTLGVYASVLVAVANGANDIANSVATSVGAGALTLRQAIVMGCVAEALGAMTLGSLVAKTISKGVLDPEVFDLEGCPGVLKFGVSMFCVLMGTGLVTLLATLYGLPISASHGVIGGLLAVGLVAQGPGAIGVSAFMRTVVAWVAAPTIGAVSACLVYLLIVQVVHRSSNPASRSRMIQPLFVASTVSVAVAFIVIKGPSALKIKPAPVGAAVAIAIGASVGVAHALGRSILKRLRANREQSKAVQMSFRVAGSALKVVSKFQDNFHLITSPLKWKVTLSSTTKDDGDVNQKEDAAKQAAMHFEESERPFVPLLVASAFTVAFAHGANDVGNAAGPLAAILEVTVAGEIAPTPEIPIWVLGVGTIGFVVGIAVLGSRTIATVGGKIAKLTPSKSFSVQTGAAIAVLSSSVLGLSVSTSHCLVGSVVGVGLASTFTHAGGGLNAKVLGKIVIGWVVTIPLAMLVSMLVYQIVSPHYQYPPDAVPGVNDTCT
jgi:phosphate/sulfate permease